MIGRHKRDHGKQYHASKSFTFALSFAKIKTKNLLWESGRLEEEKGFRDDDTNKIAVDLNEEIGKTIGKIDIKMK